jgi:sulfide:quinone oxidoreductase
MGGMYLKRAGYITPSSIFNASLFAERGIDWITRAHVQKVAPDRVFYETLDGTEGEQEFDFAMLLPPFSGVGLSAFDREGVEITERLFLANQFMRVDADYTAKPYEDWKASDWPRTYQSPEYDNIFAAGIAFAPPHAISRPHTSPNGTLIAPAPPRTGMPSATIAKAVARSIVDMIGGLDDRLSDRARLRALPDLRSRPGPHVRRDRTRRSLDQDPAAPPLPLQGAAAAGLASDPGVIAWTTIRRST